jgi:hypothetical protein
VHSGARLFRLVIRLRSSTGEANSWLLQLTTVMIELKTPSDGSLPFPAYAAHSNLTAEDLGVIWKVAACCTGHVDPEKVMEEVAESNKASFDKLRNLGVIKLKTEVNHEKKTVTCHLHIDLHPRTIEAVNINFDKYDELIAKYKSSHEQHIDHDIDPSNNAG